MSNFMSSLLLKQYGELLGGKEGSVEDELLGGEEDKDTVQCRCNVVQCFFSTKVSSNQIVSAQ